MKRSRRVGRSGVALAALGLAACSGKLAGAGPREPPPAEEAASPAERDPIEGVNRKLFWFNDRVDVYVLEPVARGWDWLAPDPVQRSVSNFFANLRFPIVTASDLLQGKPKDAGVDVGRFLVNTTVGVAGFFDPATGWGLEQHEEDFGQTLGRWGLGPGPYLMIPILGPSSPRDAVGLIVDIPLAVTPFFVSSYILLGAGTADVVNERSQTLEEVENAKAASLDYYSFVRNAYFQRRAALVADRAELTDRDAEDLYYPDAEEEVP